MPLAFTQEDFLVVNDFDVKESARCCRVFVVSGIQYNFMLGFAFM